MATYVLGDLHGYMEIYKKVKSLLKPEDKVIFVGDACDRGPESWECVKAIYNDPQFIYLKGNHEDMFVRAAEDYIERGYWVNETASLCRRNGGKDTLNSWLEDPDKVNWLNRIEKLPVIFTYTNEDCTFIITHAGYTPWRNFKLPCDYDLMWNRDHYLDTWLNKDMENVIIVHGHTPNEYLTGDLFLEWNFKNVVWYSDGHKVCVDTGGFYTGFWTLLNLDTYEEIFIELDGNHEMCF